MHKYKSLSIFIVLALVLSTLGLSNPGPGFRQQPVTASSFPWNLEMINMGKSWDITSGNPKVTVAIIGWGVDASNPHVANNIVASWDFVDGRQQVSDLTGHDTFAAGIILSIAPNVSIITARIMDWQGHEVGKLDQAIEFVTARGADIILMPITILEPQPTNRYIDKVQSEVINAYSRQVRFIIGAQGRGRHHSHRFPGYLGGVYNIAGVDRQGYNSLNSTANELNFISAPCEQIPGIETRGDWTNIPGTSWSSAHAAGVVALMLSANPFLNNVEIENILIDTAQDRGVFGRDIYYGWGLVDCYEAVKKSRELVFTDIVTDSLDYRLHPYNNDISHILKW